MRRWAVLVAVAALALGACRGQHESLVPTATLPQGTTTTDPYAVPAVIDEVYVNRVLAGLDHAYGEITRIVVGTRSLPPEVLERLKALYAGDLLQLRIDAIAFDLSRGLPGYLNPVGDNQSTVRKLISAKPNCIFVEVSRDDSAVVASPHPLFATQWIALVPVSLIEPSVGHNPTSWAFLFEGSTEERTAPQDPCATIA